LALAGLDVSVDVDGISRCLENFQELKAVRHRVQRMENVRKKSILVQRGQVDFVAKRKKDARDYVGKRGPESVSNDKQLLFFDVAKWPFLGGFFQRHICGVEDILVVEHLAPLDDNLGADGHGVEWL